MKLRADSSLGPPRPASARLGRLADLFWLARHTGLVFRIGCTGQLHSLQSVMARSRGQPNTSSRPPRHWLLPSMLERGVTPQAGDGRLACFLRACAARPVVVAALGGSVTSGLAYKVLSAKDQVCNSTRTASTRTPTCLPCRVLCCLRTVYLL